jgi:hypothetical protein
VAAPQAGDKVEAAVQIVREGMYYVVSLPAQGQALAFLPVVPHPNLQPPPSADDDEAGAAAAAPAHALGTVLQAAVAVAGCAETGGRLLLAPVAGGGGGAKAPGGAAGAAAAKGGGEAVQGLVNVAVAAVTPLGLEVTVGQVRGGAGLPRGEGGWAWKA